MYRYKYNTSYHHKSRRARRTTVLAFLVTAAVLVGAGVIAFDLLRQSKNKDEPVSQATVSSVRGTSVNLFKTEYFQFQTDDTWKEMQSESTPTRFAYQSYKGPLVEHDLVIEINPKPEIEASARTNHVLPVQIENAGNITVVDGAGDHCGKSYKKDEVKNPHKVTLRQVSFICSPDSVVYQVRVGVIGASDDILVTRPNGQKVVYRITYRNLKFTPDDGTVRNIISTFQIR